MKKKQFAKEPPKLSNLHDANVLITELWEKLREYEDRLSASSKNSSRSPSGDSPAAKAERKKLHYLADDLRRALNQVTKDTADR